ncbi:MAG: DEAD/DEAH box helicase [Opitutales bacterium]
MQSYIPNESFASQYAEWGELPPDFFKRLPASEKMKQGGALLFTEGHVSDLKPLKERMGFAAGVSDEGKTYGTAVWVEPGTETPAFECGCARPDKAKLCPHVIALLAALDYLFHERNSIPLSPLTENVEHLARQIDQSSRLRKKQLRRIRLRGLRTKTPYIEGDSTLGESIIQAINPYGEMRRMARNTVELPLHDLHTTLRTLIDFVRDSSRLQLEAETADGDFIKLRPELASIPARLRFTPDVNARQIRITEVAEAIDPGKVVARLGPKHYIFCDGRVACIDEMRTARLKSAFVDKETGFSEFDAARDALPINFFNECVLRLADYERRLYRQCRFSPGDLSSDTTAEEAPSAKSREIRLRLQLTSTTATHNTNYRATISASIGGCQLDASRVFEDFMTTLVHHTKRAERLLGRRRRCLQLLEAAAHLPTLAKKAERTHFIENFSHRAVFEKPEHQKATKKFLQQIERDFCRSKSALAPLWLPKDPRGDDAEHAWQSAHLPLSALLALTATLYQHSAFQEIIGMKLRSIEVPADGPTLSALAQVCEAWDIDFETDRNLTRSRPTIIELLFEADVETDWFELTPTVRCDGIDIPPEAWEQLLQGTLLLKAKDDSVLMPRVEHTDALHTLINHYSRSPASAKPVHRLHLLDWLELRAQGITVRLPPEIETLYESLKNFKSVPTRKIPQGLEAELRPYQKQGFEWLTFLYQHRLGACLADDMGLGKTLQALTFLAALREQAPPDKPLRALAVLPTSLIYNWQNEAARFLPDMRVQAYSGADRQPAMLEQADLALTSYDLLWRDIDTLSSTSFDVVIFDEAQALKNHRSRRANAARQLDRRFTLCLTGTPMENHPGEFHSIMDFALPGLMGPRKAFDEAIRGGDERPLRRSRPFLLRRTKDAILQELPPKVQADLILEMTDEQRTIYTRIVNEVRQQVQAAYRQQTRAQAGISALAALTRLRQICVSPCLLNISTDQIAPKIQHLLDQIEELKEEGESVLVFSQFVKALDLLEKELRRAGFDPLRLDGKTPAKARGEAVDTFQQSETPRVFLISLKAGGTGLNLTRASHVFHLDPWWNPATENQASDRAHRIGQQHTVFIHRLIMRESIEEKITQLKARKQKLFDAIVNDPTADQSGGQAIQKEDFDFLLGT